MLLYMFLRASNTDPIVHVILNFGLCIKRNIYKYFTNTLIKGSWVKLIGLLIFSA